MKKSRKTCRMTLEERKLRREIIKQKRLQNVLDLLRHNGYRVFI